MAEIKKGKNVKGVKFVTPEGRLSYPALFSPVDNYKKTGKEFKCELLFPKDADLKAFKLQIDRAAAEVYGPDRKLWPKDLNFPLKDQQELIDKILAKDSEADVSHLTPGAMFCRFKTNAGKGAAPVVTNRKNQIVTDPTVVYGGCYGLVGGIVKAQISPVGKYIVPYLAGFQMLREGTPFGGTRLSAEQMFAAVEDEPFSNEGSPSADDLVG